MIRGTGGAPPVYYSLIVPPRPLDTAESLPDPLFRFIQTLVEVDHFTRDNMTRGPLSCSRLRIDASRSGVSDSLCDRGHIKARLKRHITTIGQSRSGVRKRQIHSQWRYATLRKKRWRSELLTEVVSTSLLSPCYFQVSRGF